MVTEERGGINSLCFDGNVQTWLRSERFIKRVNSRVGENEKAPDTGDSFRKRSDKRLLYHTCTVYTPVFLIRL